MDEAVHAGPARAVEKQHARGKMTARERIDLLLDPGLFVEFDELARHRSTAFGMETNWPYGDGVVTGFGTVEGRQIGRVRPGLHRLRGSLGQVFGEKIVKVMDFALKTGCPMWASTTPAVHASRRAWSRSASTARYSTATSWRPASSRRSR